MSVAEIQSNIARVDKALGVLRDGWMDAKPDKQSKWMERINTALDERLSFMASHNAATTNQL